MGNFNLVYNRFIKSRVFWPLMTLLLVLFFNFCFTPGFFHVEIKDGHLFGSVIDILNRAAPLMLLAIGMTLVIATKGIDISVGSVIAISGAVSAMLIGGKMVFIDGVQQYVTLVPFPLAIGAALLSGLLLGAWNGMLVSRLGIQPIVATLILLVAGRGLAQLLTQGQIITIYYKPFHFIGGGYLLGLPFSIFIVAAMLALAMYAVKKTALGLFIEAVGSNQIASWYSGINSKNVIFFVYVFCGLCASIAGMIISSNIKCADSNNAGLFIELDAILAVALGGNSLEGGRFSIMGSVIGAMVIQSITTTIYAIGVPPEITLVVKAIVVIGICLMQSEEFRTTIFGKDSKKGGVLYEKSAIKQ